MDSSAPTPGVPPSGGPSPPLPDVNKLIGQYVTLRDRKEALEKKHKDELKPFTKLMQEIEGLMLDYLNRSGVNSVSGDGGTMYKSTVPRCTIRDREAFRNFVIAMAAFDLVDWRANANAVQEHISENTGQQPPGVNFSTFTSVRFRRPGEE